MPQLIRRFGPVSIAFDGEPAFLSMVEHAFVVPCHEEGIHVDMRVSGRELSAPAVDPCVEHGASPLFFHEQTRVRAEQNRLWVWDGSSVCQAAGGGRDVLLSWHADSLESDDFARTYLYVLVSLLLRKWGVFYVHGALVGTDDERLLLLGESGAGKSTTTLTLITAGWRWWTDDAALIWLDDAGTPMFAGIARPFHLTERTLGVFPELRAHVGGAAAGTGKAITLVHEVLPPATAPQSEVGTVFLSSERASTTRATSMNQASVFAALGRACAWFGIAALPQADQQLRVVMAYAARAKGVEITPGPDCLGDASVLADALKSARTAGRPQS
jgi:hypothetical protein